MNDSELYHDEYGTAWEVDSDGRKRVPERAEVINSSSTWTEYNTSRGHCGLCGSLYCKGTCVK